MKRLEFLKLSLQLKNYKKSEWMYSAFSVTRQDENSWKSNPYEGRVVSQPWGHSVIINNELVKIDDSKPNSALFSMGEEILIDPSWIPNLSKEVSVLTGTLIVNQILLVENFGAKIPFVEDSIRIRPIEEFIVAHRGEVIKGQERDPKKIYLDEYLSMGKSIEYLKTLMTLSVYSLTERNILPPPNIDAKKKELASKYGDQLNDSVILAKYEKELLEFDKDYMKGDPSDGKLIDGKIRNNGRRKLFLTSGAEGGLKGAMVPVTQSLFEGPPLNPKSFTAIVNGSRAGSYFRGVDTVKGGVSAKIVIRVLSTFEVKEGDCGTLLGIERTYNKFTLPNLVGRKLAGSKNSEIVENLNAAGNYLGKAIRVRSTMYCQYPGQTFCEACAGPKLSRFKKGLAIPGTDLTSMILAASMASMHKNGFTIAKLDLKTAMS